MVIPKLPSQSSTLFRGPAQPSTPSDGPDPRPPHIPRLPRTVPGRLFLPGDHPGDHRRGRRRASPLTLIAPLPPRNLPPLQTACTEGFSAADVHLGWTPSPTFPSSCACTSTHMKGSSPFLRPTFPVSAGPKLQGCHFLPATMPGADSPAGEQGGHREGCVPPPPRRYLRSLSPRPCKQRARAQCNLCATSHHPSIPPPPSPPRSLLSNYSKSRFPLCSMVSVASFRPLEVFRPSIQIRFHLMTCPKGEVFALFFAQIFYKIRSVQT